MVLAVTLTFDYEEEVVIQFYWNNNDPLPNPLIE